MQRNLKKNPSPSHVRTLWRVILL